MSVGTAPGSPGAGLTACPPRSPRGLPRRARMADRADPILEAHEFFRRGPANEEGWSMLIGLVIASGRLLPRPLASRQGRALDARRQLHRLVLVEGLRQGRARHLGDAGRRTTRPTGRTCPNTSRAAAPAARRSPGTSTRRSASAIRMCAAACSDVPGGARAHRRPGRCLGGDRRGPREGAAYKSSAARADSCAPLGRGSEIIAAAHVYTIKRYGPDRIVGFLADPGDAHGLLRGRHPLPVADRRSIAVVLRLVRRPAAGLAADLGRPDGRPESADWWNSGYLISGARTSRRPARRTRTS